MVAWSLGVNRLNSRAPMEAVAGLVATVVAEVVLTPIECIKTWQQSSAHPVSFLRAASQLRSVGGVSAFWAGAYPFFLFNAIGGGIKFGVYEPLRRRLSALLPSQVANYISAGSAFLVAAIVLVPSHAFISGSAISDRPKRNVRCRYLAS